MGRSKLRQVVIAALLSTAAAVAQQAANSSEAAAAAGVPGAVKMVGEEAAAGGGSARHLFPFGGVKLSFSSAAERGGRTFLDFIEHTFAVILPEMAWVFLILGIFVVLAHIVPPLVADTLQRLGAAPSKSISAYYVLQYLLFFSGLYWSLRSIGVDFVSLALFLNVVAIIMQAAFADRIARASDAVWIQYGGNVQIGHEFEGAGVHGTTIEMTHSDILVRTLENPRKIAIIPNNIVVAAIIYKFDDGPLPDMLQSMAAGAQLDTRTRVTLEAHEISKNK